MSIYIVCFEFFRLYIRIFVVEVYLTYESFWGQLNEDYSCYYRETAKRSINLPSNCVIVKLQQ